MIDQLSDMSGNTVIVTGGTGFLGRVISETLAEKGANLIIIDKDGTEFENFSVNLRNKHSISISFYECDLESETDRQKLIDRLKKDRTKVSCLINNAAYVSATNLTGWTTAFEDQSLEIWRRALEVNLTAPFHFAQAFCPELKKEKDGNIINITSIYGKLGPDWRLYSGTNMGNPAAYSVSKGGLEQLTRWLATTIAPDIRVNAICPGGIFRDQDRAFVTRYQERTPLKRMATENDFRGVIAFLASRQASYVTGQTISIDGGFSTW